MKKLILVGLYLSSFLFAQEWIFSRPNEYMIPRSFSIGKKETYLVSSRFNEKNSPVTGVWFAILDSDGKILWEKTIKTQKKAAMFPIGIAMASFDEVIVAYGERALQNPEGQIWVQSIHWQSKRENWEYTYADAAQAHSGGLIVKADGTVVVAHSHDSSQTASGARITWLNSQGKMIREFLSGPTMDERFLQGKLFEDSSAPGGIFHVASVMDFHLIPIVGAYSIFRGNLEPAGNLNWRNKIQNGWVGGTASAGFMSIPYFDAVLNGKSLFIATTRTNIEFGIPNGRAPWLIEVDQKSGKVISEKIYKAELPTLSSHALGRFQNGDLALAICCDEGVAKGAAMLFSVNPSGELSSLGSIKNKNYGIETLLGAEDGLWMMGKVKNPETGLTSLWIDKKN